MKSHQRPKRSPLTMIFSRLFPKLYRPVISWGSFWGAERGVKRRPAGERGFPRGWMCSGLRFPYVSTLFQMLACAKVNTVRFFLFFLRTVIVVVFPIYAYVTVILLRKGQIMYCFKKQWTAKNRKGSTYYYGKLLRIILTIYMGKCSLRCTGVVGRLKKKRPDPKTFNPTVRTDLKTYLKH